MREWCFRLGCLAVVAGLLNGCSSVPTGAGSRLPSSSLVLLYQQGREGQMEPCGCQSSPYGGIDREWNAVRAIRGSSKRVLSVDAGNALVPEQAKAPIDFYRTRGETLIQMLGDLQLDVFAPGPTDYRLGVDYLKKQQAKAKFPFISTNVVDAKGKTVFAPYAIVDVAGTPVAVLSVTPGTKLTGGARVTEARPALEKAIAEVAPKAKLVVVLSQLGKVSSDRELATGLKGVHIWIGNDQKHTFNEANPEGNILMLDGHRFGYFLGKLTVDLKEPVTGFHSEKLLRSNQAMLAGFESGLSMMTDPKRRAIAEKKIADFKASAHLKAVAGSSPFEHELMALDEKRFGQANLLTPLIAKEKERVRRAAIDDSVDDGTKTN